MNVAVHECAVFKSYINSIEFDRLCKIQLYCLEISFTNKITMLVTSIAIFEQQKYYTSPYISHFYIQFLFFILIKDWYRTKRQSILGGRYWARSTAIIDDW